MTNAGTSEFDSYSESYQQDLQRGLDLAGENSDYFAAARVAWTAKCLADLNASVNKILDFGCGTGGSAPFLLKTFESAKLVGTDPSEPSLQIARTNVSDSRGSFVLPSGLDRDGSFDLAFCNGVFHHIDPDQRSEAFQTIIDSLCVGGYFAFWENNPWNPGTRWVMSRIPFDKDAITISPSAAVRLLSDNGFDVQRRDSAFWFPRFLSALRGLERLLIKVPLGGQYLVLCRKQMR